MPTFQSKVKTDSELYQSRYSQMKTLVEELNQKWQEAKKEGPEKYTQRHQDAGKMLARQRIEKLIDPNTQFLELMPLAGIEQKGMTLGGSIVGGIGIVHGTYCMINASVPTQKGGALNSISVQKQQRLDVIAKENSLPSIYLIESAGADLSQQALVYNNGGSAFREISRRSALGLPSISVVFGSSTAGGAYIPGMSDYTIMVKKEAKVFLAGPPLVKMATKEEANEEVLGGAEMHARVSGVCDFLANSETEAITHARELMQQRARAQAQEDSFKEPLYSSEEILGVISTDLKRPFDSREVIARLVDGSEFLEFKKEYGPTLVTGYANIHGRKVGILANNGVLNNQAANKGAHFIQLCNQEERPLLFLQNITGFMVGTKVEQEGIIKDGAKMINAVSNSKVPMYTIIMGASFGAGNYAMCGRAFEPRFLFTWPNSRLAVMGGEQLAGVLETIKRDAAAKTGSSLNEDELQASKDAIIKQINHESNPYFGTSRLWDDGIIDPCKTREVLATCLKLNSKIHATKGDFGVFRM